MPYLQTNDAKLYFETHGEGGPPIVFAHGVGGNSLAWWQQVPVFAENHKVVVFDHRGFGRSTDERNLGRKEFVNDLEYLIDHLDLEFPILVGQSMGGIACSGYLARHSHNVKALVMADTLLGLTFPENITEELQIERAKHESLPQIARAMSKQTLESCSPLPYLFSHISTFNNVNRLTLEGEYTTVDAKALSTLGVPILFLVGEEDILFAPRFVKAVQQQIVGSKYAEIPNTGHSPYFEDAGTFNEVLSDFIRDIA